MTRRLTWDALSACRQGKRDYGLYRSGPATKFRLVGHPQLPASPAKKFCGN